MSGRHKGANEWSTCAPCGGKRRYRYRKDAKVAAKLTPGKLHPYPCPVVPDGWHIGHMAAPVREGRVSRSDLYK